MNVRIMNHGDKKSFSLVYNDWARWFFLLMFFSAMLSTFVLGTQLAITYAVLDKIDFLYFVFTIFSGLGSVWGIMAYREFTKTSNIVNNTRTLAYRLNPRIGKYEYKSYNPVTHEFEDGYVPFGPIDFWDPATYAPDWIDKGKYWHVLLGLQVPNKELILQVVKDDDLIGTKKRNVATTEMETLRFARNLSGSGKRYRYRVKIPQWAVMRAEYQGTKSNDQERIITNREIGNLNRNIVQLVDELIERERFRMKYPWKITGLWIYLYKSLPLKIIYDEILEKLPGFHKSIVKEANETLADIKEDKLIMAITDVAKNKGMSDSYIEKISILIRFLNGVYSDIGLGEGSTEYHNFHHSLEVSYMSLKMLPDSINDYRFSAEDIEIILVAALLHDYDPLQFTINGNSPKYQTDEISKLGSNVRLSVGPRVHRTIETIQRYQIHDAFFMLEPPDLEKIFEKFSFKFSVQPNVQIPRERIRGSERSMMVEALIWRTDFPYFKNDNSQKMYKELLSKLKSKGHDIGKINTLAEVLWLSDLSVTYMGSDPIRAWNRVTSLYDELFLPKLEAVSRTDSYFSDFADMDLFQKLIRMKNFPDVFKNRWNAIYQFFHEGNPSTVLIRTITNARESYLKINILIGFFKGEFLYELANEVWAEFFIGIGEDQNEISDAKSMIMDLEPQNAAVFWGNASKLLPNIHDNSVDNFIINLPNSSGSDILAHKELLSSMIRTISAKITEHGTLQIVTDIPRKSDFLDSIYMELLSKDFSDCSENSNSFFPSKLDLKSLTNYSHPYLISFCKRTQ